MEWPEGCGGGVPTHHKPHGQVNFGSLQVDPPGHLDRREWTYPSQSPSGLQTGSVRPETAGQTAQRGGGEILMRGDGAVVQRLRAASGTRPGETVEPQDWSQSRTFPGQVYIDKEKPALETAKEWRSRDTVWTDGSRFDSGEVGAACVWKDGERWKGSRYHLGNNKEVFDAGVFAIYQALKACERGQASGRRYTIFSDSQSAILRIRSDELGPGQLWARAEIEVCSRLIQSGNKVTVRWVPAHVGVEGNEVADRFAKEAAEGHQHSVSDKLRWEASLSYLSRVTTERRSEATAQ